MRKLTFILTYLLLVTTCWAETIYVDVNSPNEPGSGSQADPFRYIQDGIDAATGGYTVLVAKGTYYENININGKYFFLTGTDPNDPNIVATTIIDGNSLGSVVTIVDANFADANAVIEGFTVTNGLADVNGGGIYCENSNVSFSNCIITGNKTADGEDNWDLNGGNGGDGGGVYCVTSSITIVNTLITGNTTGDGGDAHDGSYRGGNSGDGAGIYCSYSSLILDNSNISSNINGVGGEYQFGPKGNGGSGGGIYCEASSFTIIDCNVTENEAGNSGYGYWNAANGGSGGGIYYIGSLPLTITNSNISNNKAGDALDPANGGSGGGIYFASSSLLTITNSTINNNTAGSLVYASVLENNAGSGGGIYCTSSLLVTNCNIIGNIAGNVTADNGSPGNGGGLFCISLLTAQDCNIIGNKAGDGGFVMETTDSSDGGDGGGIYCSLAVITNCTISNNVTGLGGSVGSGWDGNGGDGGGIYCSSGTIDNCTISGNVTGNGGLGQETWAGDGGNGAGIYCASGQVTINDCTFIDNVTGNGGDQSHEDGGDGGNGGGVYCTSSADVRISYCTFIGNQTGDGGRDGSASWWSLGGNGGDGGGIFSASVTTTIHHCKFIENGTGDGALSSQNYGGDGGSGGGIMCSSATITNCIITNNSTGAGGDGGIYPDWPEPTCHPGGDGGDGAGIFGPSATITNCTIVDNTTGPGGNGAEWPDYCSAEDGSRGEGAGVRADGSTIITNTIIWNNSADQLFGQDCNNVTYCDISDGTCGGQNGNISADPCFGDPCNGDYHLKSYCGRWHSSCQAWIYDDVTSPCIDAGDPNDPNWVNELWPHGKRTNMGAYGGTSEASMSSSAAGNMADLDISGMVNFKDYSILAGDWHGHNTRTIPRGAVVVDGDLTDWSGNTEWIALDIPYDDDEPCDINEARFALRWDGQTDKIYLAVVVEDSEHILSDIFDTFDASDRIEIFCQGDAAGGDYTYLDDIAQQYFVAPDTNGGSWATMGYGEPNITGTDLEYAVRVNGDLIIYEVGVKQFDNYGGLSGGETVVTDLHLGHVVRFDLVTASRWNGGIDYGRFAENYMRGKYRIADNIQLYSLVDEAVVPPCPELKGDLDRNCILDFRDLMTLCNNWLSAEPQWPRASP